MEENRLKIIREELSGISQSKLAELLGFPSYKIRDIESGKVKMSPDIARGLEEKFHFSFTWVMSGVGPKRKTGQIEEAEGAPYRSGEEFVHVPRYEIEASAGGGCVVQSEQVVDYLAFKQEWLKTHLGLSAANLAVISVLGDSMEPYLFNGDLIMIDTHVSKIESDAIYVLQVDGALLVKRIQKKMDGTVIVKSDNEHYEPEVFRGDSIDRIRVVGRMVRRLVK